MSHYSPKKSFQRTYKQKHLIYNPSWNGWQRGLKWSKGKRSTHGDTLGLRCNDVKHQHGSTAERLRHRGGASFKNGYVKIISTQADTVAAVSVTGSERVSKRRTTRYANHKPRCGNHNFLYSHFGIVYASLEKDCSLLKKAHLLCYPACISDPWSGRVLLFFIHLMVCQLSANNHFFSVILQHPADQTISVGPLIQQIHLPADYWQ